MASLAGNGVRQSWREIPAKYPFAFGIFISTIKTSFSDLLVQKVVEQREQVDWKRNAAFASFGFFYLGGVQYMIYVPLFSRLFPGAASFAAKPLREKLNDTRGIFNVAAQVFIDQCIHHPLMYFPAFYMTKELVMREKPDIRRVLAEYRRNMWEDLQALWKVWVPTTFLNFAFMPMWARIPWVAGTSLLWTCILSAMRGGDVAHGEEMAGGAVTGATLSLIEEGYDMLFTTPVELERGLEHLVLTACGHDKTGWVSLLSRTVASEGGNITHSKMVRLGNDFIVTMHVSVPPAQHKSLVKKLRRDPELKPLSIRSTNIARRKTGSFEVPVTGIRIRCRGADRPGMLAKVSTALADKGLSIENITTDVVVTKSGVKEFQIKADAVLTTYMDDSHLDELTRDLSHLKEELQLDVVDVRVHRLVHKDA